MSCVSFQSHATEQQTIKATASWHFVPRAFVSLRNFDDSIGNGGVDGRVDSLGVGLTGTYRRFYINASLETTPQDNEESVRHILPVNKANFNRDDSSLSVGYVVNDAIRVFGGYKYGKTIISALDTSEFSGAEISLKGNGFFMGAGAGWRIGSGFMSFSAAYASLQAKYQYVDDPALKGDATGTSLVLQWQAPITKALTYHLSATRHDYYYDNFKTLDSDISEQIFSLRLGLSYQF